MDGVLVVGRTLAQGRAACPFDVCGVCVCDLVNAARWGGRGTGREVALSMWQAWHLLPPINESLQKGQ